MSIGRSFEATDVRIIVILKALTEVAGVAMIGQGILWVIAGAKRDQNLVYGLFKALTPPGDEGDALDHATRHSGRHLGLVAVFPAACPLALD